MTLREIAMDTEVPRELRTVQRLAPVNAPADHDGAEEAGSYEDPQPVRRALDEVDVVLGEWLNQRPEVELAPVALTARVSLLAQLLQQRMEQASTRFKLDWGQFLLLAALRGAGMPFRMSPRELHRLLLLSPAAVTNRLYRLEAKGLIERTTDPSDRRSLPVVLTALGHSTIDRAMAECIDSGRDLLSDVELDELERTLRTMRAVLASQDTEPRRRTPRQAPSEMLRAVPPLAREPASAVQASPAPLPRREAWPDSDRDLIRLQRKLARTVDDAMPMLWTRDRHLTIGGVFVSIPTSKLAEAHRDIAWAGTVVMEGHRVIATATATRALAGPYAPGYLALAVGPILEDVVRSLPHRPEVVILNAAGVDHIRGAGLAIQLGAALDIPTVGVTESPVVGFAPEPGGERGDATAVRTKERLVGFRVRTLAGAKSVMAHAAWRTTPETARKIVIGTTGAIRFPEPLHRARQLSRKLRSEYGRADLAGLEDGIHG